MLGSITFKCELTLSLWPSTSECVHDEGLISVSNVIVLCEVIDVCVFLCRGGRLEAETANHNLRVCEFFL